MARARQLKKQSLFKRHRIKRGPQITAHGLNQADKNMQARIKAVKDLTIPMKQGATRIEELIDESFEMERCQLNGYEKKLATQAALDRAFHEEKRKGGLTKKAKQAREKMLGEIFDHSILFISGDLKNSWFARGKKRSIVVGSNKSYARHHQAGTADMVSREMAPFELVGSTWKRIERGPAKIAFDYIRNLIKRHVTQDERRRARV
jgi:phage gpG-like protein